MCRDIGMIVFKGETEGIADDCVRVPRALGRRFYYAYTYATHSDTISQASKNFYQYLKVFAKVCTSRIFAIPNSCGNGMYVFLSSISRSAA